MRTSLSCPDSRPLARALGCAAVVLLVACGSEHAPPNDSPHDAGTDSSIPGPPSQSGTGGAAGLPFPQPAGTGGFLPIAGTGGTICNGVMCCNEMGCFPVPPGGGTCFDCGGGCFDCGFGCECSNAFTPPAWNPPFSSVGEPGWGESTEALCAGMPEIWSADLWASAGGVHLVVSGLGPETFPGDADGGVTSTSTANLAAPRPAPGFPGTAGFFGMPPFVGGEVMPRTRVLRNEGSGWRRRAEIDGATSDIGMWGVSDRELLIGSGFREEGAGTCMLAHVSGSSVECTPADPIDDIFVVSPTEAYALMLGTRLLRWDGEIWTNESVAPLLPYPAQVLWSNGTDLFAFGTAGTVLRRTSVGWELIDLGTFESFTAVWGTAADDLWLGTASGRVMYYDGETLEERYTLAGMSCSRQMPVRGLYQSGDTLYMHTYTKLARARNGGALESIGDWTCQFGGVEPMILSVSGTSANDAFVLMMDQNIGSQCGALFTLHYDGAEFHRM